MTARNPHLPGEGHSPLDALIRQALRRYGDFHASTVEGEAALLLLEFANLVLDDIQQSPYWIEPDGTSLDVAPYEALTDIRPVPDPIIVAGLLAHLSIQQASAKQRTLYPLYTQTLNSYLWRRLNGNAPIRARPVDGGSNLAHSPQANPVNGLLQNAPAISIRRRT